MAGQRSIVEAASSNCWFRGHTLLRAIADSQPWRGTCWSKEDTKAVFGNKYFAKVSTRDIVDVLKYEKVEQKWQDEGRQGLPGYFRNFGVVDAEQYLKKLKEKALEEAKSKHSRQPTSAENHCIEVLRELANELDPETMKVLGRGRATYCVAETEVLLGQLKKGRTWGSREVVMAASGFLADFSEAVSIFLHEHSHIFGRDGSREFTDALTELLGMVIEKRNDLDVYEELWNDARTKVCEERNESGNNNKEIEVLLNSKNETELRELLQRVPNGVLRRLLEPNENKVAAYLEM